MADIDVLVKRAHEIANGASTTDAEINRTLVALAEALERERSELMFARQQRDVILSELGKRGEPEHGIETEYAKAMNRAGYEQGKADALAEYTKQRVAFVLRLLVPERPKGEESE